MACLSFGIAVFLSRYGHGSGGAEAQELDATLAVGGTHHGYFDTLSAHFGDAVSPFTIDELCNLRFAALRSGGFRSTALSTHHNS
jgi:hypothetical protein